MTHHDIQRFISNVRCNLIHVCSKELLAAVVYVTAPKEYRKEAFRQVVQNGTWGTCGGCPVIHGQKHPNLCKYFGRNDHKIAYHISGDRFYYDYHERTRHYLERVFNANFQERNPGRHQSFY